MARQVPRWGPGTCILECDSRGLRSTLMASPACTGTAPFLCLAGHRPPRRPRGRAEATVPATAWPPGQMPRDWLPAKRTIVLSFGRRLTTCACTDTRTHVYRHAHLTHLAPTYTPAHASTGTHMYTFIWAHARTRLHMTIHGHIDLRPLRLPVLNMQQDVPGRGLHAWLRVPRDKQDQGTAAVFQRLKSGNLRQTHVSEENGT